MKRGLWLVFLTALISGVSIFVNAFGVRGINPYVFTGAKNLAVGIFLLSIILFLGHYKDLKKLSLKDWRNLALIGLLGGSIPFLLFFKGLQLSTAAQGSFIHKTMVVWVAVLAMFFLKEKLDRKIVVGAIALLIGNFLLLNFSGIDLTMGLFLVFIATLFWAAEITFAKKVLEKLSGNIVAFGRMFFGSIFILVFLAFTGQLSLVTALGASQLTWIGITSAFLLGYVMTFYNGLKEVKASTAVAVLSLGSVITTLLNLIFLDKIITLAQVYGLVFVALGVIVFTLNIDKIRNYYAARA